DGGSGAGWRRRRRPGALGRPTGDHWNPLTWANTDSEGGGGRPAHLHVARVTWGRASRPRIGPPAPLMGGVRGGRAVQGAGKRGSGSQEGATEERNAPFTPSNDPCLATLGDRRGGASSPGGTTRGYTSLGPTPRRAGLTARPAPSLNPTYGTRPLAGSASPDGEH